MRELFTHFRKALWLAIEHEALNYAKAAAYSGMLMIFPTLVVLTALLAVVPAGTTLLGEIRSAFEQFLPADTMYLVQSSMQGHRFFSFQLIASAMALSVFAGLGLMLSLMEGFRRSYRQPRGEWGFWERRMRALMLVPISLIPLAAATLVLVFGRQIELWLFHRVFHQLRTVVVLLWRLGRWAVAMVTSVSVLTAVYHFGTRRGENWRNVMPGAISATLVWFPSTLAFGWYVTRDAHYSMFYGSFAAGIATLVWLYISAFSVLLGAEFNGVLFRERNRQETGDEPVLTQDPFIS
jgi:membrane protein